MMLQIDLSGHLALVTGATGELGRSIVCTLAQAGADVVVHYYKNKEQADKLVLRVEEFGRKAIALQADIANLESVFKLRDDINILLGDPDIVVANAVIQYQWKSILEQSMEDYEAQYNSCVVQAVSLAKAFVPAMREKKFGRFIAINSECSMLCLPKQSAYVAGKRGLDGVLRVLAHEVGKDGITVNQVAPGWLVTENKPEELSQSKYLEYIPLGRRGYDSEVAGTVAFLASDLASFITGVYMPVCGGHVMPAI